MVYVDIGRRFCHWGANKIIFAKSEGKSTEHTYSSARQNIYPISPYRRHRLAAWQRGGGQLTWHTGRWCTFRLSCGWCFHRTVGWKATKKKKRNDKKRNATKQARKGTKQKRNVNEKKYRNVDRQKYIYILETTTQTETKQHENKKRNQSQWELVMSHFTHNKKQTKTRTYQTNREAQADGKTTERKANDCLRQQTT